MPNISKINPSIALDQILNSKENVYFERKSMEITPSKLANSVIGMANAEGGLIVLGVNSGKIEDLKTLKNTRYNDFKQIGIDFIKPPCNFEIEEVEIKGKTIFLYHIEPDFERLYMKKTENEEVYLRIGDETRLLNRDEVKQIEYDKTIRKYEDEFVLNFDENDFEMNVVNHYKEILTYSGDFRDMLVNRYLAEKKDGKYFYKRSAVLLFSKDPEKYMASASVRYVRYNGTFEKTGRELNVVKDQRFIGPIPNLVEEVKKFLQTIFREYHFLDIYSGKFVKVAEYPEDAWLEGVVNALTHRSYNLQGNVILIKHYDDRFEISNSGPLPSFIDLNNITDKRFARNPRIARVLFELGLVKELNEGVKRIFKVMKESFLAKPEYLIGSGMVVLILKNNNVDDNRVMTEQKKLLIEREFDGLNETSKKIVLELSQHNGITAKDLAKKIKMTERTTQLHLKELIKKEIAQRYFKESKITVYYSL